MKRREFITLLGGAVSAWPLGARAQQPAMPVVGFLYAGLPGLVPMAAFLRPCCRRRGGACMGIHADFVEASDDRELEIAFTIIAANKDEVLLVLPDTFFVGQRAQITALAARHAIPAAYAVREYAEAGGLVSYGTSLAEIYGHLGLYTVRILRGAKPADLPVVQSTKFELVINLKTARALGIEIPPTLLARADEVIE